MKKTEYIVQGFGEIKDIGRNGLKRWYDLDNRGDDRQGAIESCKDFKDGEIPKVRLIIRTTTEKRLR